MKIRFRKQNWHKMPSKITILRTTIVKLAMSINHSIQNQELEEAEKEMYRGEEEEVETSGFGKSSSQEASTLSSENSGNYHSFGEAQVPIKELLKSKMPF